MRAGRGRNDEHRLPNGPPSRSGSGSGRRGAAEVAAQPQSPQGLGAEAGALEGMGSGGVETMVSDVAMLVPSVSVSLQPLVSWPSPHHYSPSQVTNSYFSRSPAKPELSRVYKLPLEERAEPHFKGHRLPQASVLSREIGLTSRLPAPVPAFPPFLLVPLPSTHTPLLPFFRTERLRVR